MIKIIKLKRNTANNAKERSKENKGVYTQGATNDVHRVRRYAKRQMPYLTYVEKFTVVRWRTLSNPFLCTLRKSLITWPTPLFFCGVNLMITKSSINLFKSFLFPS